MTSNLASAPGTRSLELADSLWAPVLAIYDETEDVRTFRLGRPVGLDFRAGQSLVVNVEVGGRHVPRRYSISSAPDSLGYIDITVKRGERASTALHETVGVGSVLSVNAPEGSFVYPEGDDRSLVLIGGGTGCIPLVSMLRHAVRSDPFRQVTYLFSGRTARSVLFRRELDVLARHPRVRIGLTLTKERRPGYLSGRIDARLLARSTPVPSQSLFYVSGPPPMIARVSQLLAQLGVPDDQVRRGTFGELVDDHPEPEDVGPEEAPAAAAAAPVPVATSAPAARPRREPVREEEIEWRIDALREATLGTAVQPRRPRAAPAPALHVSDEPEPDQEPAPDQWEVTMRGRNRYRRGFKPQIKRFRRGERLLHWSIAIPFLTCLFTGLTMKFFFGLHPEGIARDVLSFVHRVSGGALAVFPTLAVLRCWDDLDIHLYNVKIGWIWTMDDLKWLVLMGPAAVSERFTLPEQRKFNAAERLNFMMVMATYPLFVATGLILWSPGVHFAAWLVHVGLVVAVVPLVFGHMYMAVLNPTTRVGLSGMVSGFVDREWAKHHYSRWYRDHFEDGTSGKP